MNLQWPPRTNLSFGHFSRSGLPQLSISLTHSLTHSVSVSISVLFRICWIHGDNIIIHVGAGRPPRTRPRHVDSCHERPPVDDFSAGYRVRNREACPLPPPHSPCTTARLRARIHDDDPLSAEGERARRTGRERLKIWRHLRPPGNALDTPRETVADELKPQIFSRGS